MFSLCGCSYITVRPNYVKHSREGKVQHFLNVVSFIERHAPLQQLSILINLQALSQRPQPFEWHLRVQAQITSPAHQIDAERFPYRRCSPATEGVCVRACALVRLAQLRLCLFVLPSHLSIVSVVWCVRGTRRPHRRVNLRHLLCTSSIFLDSWHFTSRTNCQLSKLNFRNDMLKFTPFPSAPCRHSCSPLLLLPPLPPAAPCLSQRAPLCIYLHGITGNFQHTLKEDKWSSVLAPPPPAFSFVLPLSSLSPK